MRYNLWLLIINQTYRYNMRGFLEYMHCLLAAMLFALPVGLMAQEREVVVVTDTFRLPATFVAPSGSVQKVPCVVMIHGSGPNDRDETVGPNKLFRDLADSLLAHGIASLRYEKRTRAYGAASLPAGREMDYDVEVVDDALSALRLAAQQPEVDGERLFIVGHSLGAMLAPRIAERAPKVAGVVMLAAPARKLTDLLIGQSIFLRNLYEKLPGVPQAALQQLDELQEKARNAQRLGTAQYDEALGLPAGLTPSYLAMDHQYDPVKTALALKQPLMLVQGERDYQVTMVDYALWCTGLMMRTGVTYCTYPKLNHLMREGEGAASPMEYATPKPLPQQLVADLVHFIKP